MATQDAVHGCNDDLPTCVVCCNEYREQGKRRPLVLECGHSLCYACIHSSYTFVTCPHCRAAVTLPPGSLPPNYELINVLQGGGREVAFRVQSHTRIHRILDACADATGIPAGGFTCMLDGKVVYRDYTVSGCSMEEGDVVDVHEGVMHILVTPHVEGTTQHTFRVTPCTRLSMVFDTYAQLHPDVAARRFRYRLDGKRLRRRRTVSEYGLKDCDSVQVSVAAE